MTSRNRPGAVVVAEVGQRWFGIIITAFYGVGVLWPLAAGKYRLGMDKWSPKLLTHVPGAALAAAVAIVAVGLIWGCSRSWRIGLYMDYGAVTVRNYFRTYRISWPEVTGFVDGSVPGRTWALTVLMDGGRAVTASGTASKVERDRSEVLTAIREAAESHGTTADLTGTPGAWRGPQWLPVVLSIALVCLFLAGFFLVRGAHCGNPNGCDSGG